MVAEKHCFIITIPVRSSRVNLLLFEWFTVRVDQITHICGRRQVVEGSRLISGHYIVGSNPTARTNGLTSSLATNRACEDDKFDNHSCILLQDGICGLSLEYVKRI